MHLARRIRARWRVLEVSPAQFRTAALLALAGLFLVVATGALVRLTASGLGCDNWPRCGAAPFPTSAKNGHALIEFSNRVIALAAMALALGAWLAARRVRGLPRRVSRLALAVFLGTFAQIPLGGLTVIFKLDPLLVIAHFLLALTMLALAVVVAVEARGFESAAPPQLVPPLLRLAGVVLAGSCLALVVTGSFATAAGPHSGGADIRRFGILVDAMYVHVRATAVFGCAFLAVLVYLVAKRRAAPLQLRLAFLLLGLLLAQMAVGEIQWHTQLPWWLVLVHVSLASAVLAATTALATLFWRPLPALLAGRRRHVAAAAPAVAAE